MLLEIGQKVNSVAKNLDEFCLHSTVLWNVPVTWTLGRERQVCIYVGDDHVIVPSATQAHRALPILHNISLMLVPILFPHHF